MNIAAFIIALIGGIVSILQSGCIMLIGGVVSGLDKNAEPVAGGAFLCFVAAVVAIVGGSLSLRSSGAGWKTLCAAAIISILGGLSFYGYKDAYFWAVVYGLASGLAFFDTKERHIESKDTTSDNDNKSSGMIQPQKEDDSSYYRIDQKKCSTCGYALKPHFFGILPWKCPVCAGPWKKDQQRKQRNALILFCVCITVSLFLILSFIGRSNQKQNQDETEPVKIEKFDSWQIAEISEELLATGGRIWVTVTERAVVFLIFVDDMEKYDSNTVLGYAINIAKKHSDKLKDIAFVEVENIGDRDILLNNPLVSDFKAVWLGGQVDSEMVLDIFEKPEDLPIEIETFFSSTSLVPGTGKYYLTSFPRGTRSKVERLLWGEAFNQTWMDVFTKEELCQTR
jgi:hypothetical protein